LLSESESKSGLNVLARRSDFDSDPVPDELPESISADKVTVAQPAILTEQGPLNSAGIGQGSDASPVDSPC
jgi:hypothetical protein